MPNFDKNFADALASLNSAQREAVEHIEGPTLVVAGPGTGKTHILAARIGQILTKTDTQAYNILCLTFTDAAVRAMRERLLSLIGPDAHKVNIYTFHSFCNRVIQDNLDLFGRQDLTPLDELEHRQMIRDLLDELGHEHPLKRGRGTDVYFYESHLSDLFRLMKTEAWTPQYIGRKIDEYLESLPQHIDFQYKTTKQGQFKKGDLKTEALEREVEKMEILRSASQLYGRYEAKKAAANRYDFNDMILWLIEAFERFPFLLRGYQEQFLYFLVDEFQDTNGAQNQIIAQLIAFWQQPNIFIVGDDDQAIYEFQGARLKSLVDFYEAYQKDIHLLILTENYRSTQGILDAAKNLIEQNQLRILNKIPHTPPLSKNLKAMGETARLAAQPSVIEYPNRLQETADIIQRIQTWIQADESRQKEPLTIALIYARHRQIHPFIEQLEKRGIPYTVRRASNVLNEPLIQNLRLLLQYINLESRQAFSGEHGVFRLLNLPFLGLAPKDLLLIAKYLAQEENRSTWRETLSQLPPLRFQQKNRLKSFATALESWISAVGHEPILRLVERILHQSQLMAWVLSQKEQATPVEILNVFFDFLKNETLKNPRLSLNDFLKTLDLMDANNIPIERTRYAPQAAFEHQPTAPEHRVVLTTAHAAKGLEFDKVFILDAVKSEWEEARGSAAYHFRLPETLTYTAEADALEARRRLFYVAVTRARQAVFISYAQLDERGKALQPSQFIAEMGLTAIEKRRLAAEAVLDAQKTGLTEGSKIPPELMDREYVTAILKNFQLSISALNAYLDCPLGFYFEHILKLPAQPSPRFHYGEAVHFALQKLFGEMVRSKDKTFPSSDEFVSYFTTDLYRRQAFFEPTDFAYRLQLGQESLLQYYKLNQEKFAKNVVIEKWVQGHIEGVPVRGIIDKIEFRADGTAHIVDYKTGKLKEEKLRRPTPRYPYGGDYWRQLVFYKLLYENYRAQLVRVTTGEISSVETDTRGQFKNRTYHFETKDADILRGAIRDVWAKIQARQFDGCGRKECTWCSFIKRHQTINSFQNDATEALDDN
jgi:DNA helicase-2/ATP-dependent DNA helicase PcrA